MLWGALHSACESLWRSLSNLSLTGRPVEGLSLESGSGRISGILLHLKTEGSSSKTGDLQVTVVHDGYPQRHSPAKFRSSAHPGDQGLSPVCPRKKCPGSRPRFSVCLRSVGSVNTDFKKPSKPYVIVHVEDWFENVRRSVFTRQFGVLVCGFKLQLVHGPFVSVC